MIETITFTELQKKSFTNSPDLPPVVKFMGSSGSAAYDDGFVYKRWTGIGWITVDEPANADDVPWVIDD